jgi:hypothetical protein
LFTRFPSLVNDTKESRMLAIRSVFTLGGLFDDIERSGMMPGADAFKRHTQDTARNFGPAAVDSKLDELDLKVTPADLETLLKVRQAFCVWSQPDLTTEYRTAACQSWQLFSTWFETSWSRL